MADKTPWIVAEIGTYSSGSNTIILSGTAVDLGGYPSRTFGQADADTDTDFGINDTVQVTISEDADNWQVLASVVFSSSTVLDLSSAIPLASEGTLTNGQNVYVFAGQPPAGTGDMLASVYDPQGIDGDAFARANQTGTQLLATISDAGTAAAQDVGAFDSAGTASAGDSAHTSTYDHANIPTTNQKAALDGNAKLSAGDAVAALSDIAAAGGGDMLAATYDPQTIQADAFARANHTGTQTLSTISDAGTAAAADTDDFDVAGTAAAGDSAHLSAFDHGNIPTTDQAGALDNNNTLDAGNPAASMADITLVGDDRYTQSTDDSVADVLTVTQAEYDALTPPDPTTLYLICDGAP